MNTFKVGDVVRLVDGGGWTGVSVSKPYTIEKQHKGNGNLKVGGEWYSVHGSSARRGRWHAGPSLVLDGSDECKRYMAAAARNRAVSDAREALRALDPRTLTDDQLASLVAMLRALKPSEAKP